MKKILRIAGVFALLLLGVGHAGAVGGDLRGVVDTVGGPTLISGGIAGLAEIVQTIILGLRPLLATVAALMIIISGFRMIVSQEEDAITKTKTLILDAVVGLVLIYLIRPFIIAFYEPYGVSQNYSVVNEEVAGIINWVLVIVAILCVVMIIFSAVRALANPTSEDGIANMRRTIFAIFAGIVLIVFRTIIAAAFGFGGTPNPLIAVVVTIISYILSFAGLAALLMFVYAGFLYITSLGNDEQTTKAKGLMLRVIAGIFVILFSYTIINYVIISVR